jgi:hypothetical protein
MNVRRPALSEVLLGAAHSVPTSSTGLRAPAGPSWGGPAPSASSAPAAPSSAAAARSRLDPRWYQIAMLSALLGYGVLRLDFDLGPARIAAVLAVCLTTQYLCGWLWRLPAFDPKSALISGIGLCTLLRCGSTAALLLAAAVAIASKFVIRWRGKHLFNPTNVAIGIWLATGLGWVSPSQYGSFAFAALLIACLGLTVVNRAARSDVSLAFLGGYAAILFGRSLWLGEPLTIPIHRLQSGLLLQFTFNMISDPKTTPDSRAGRILFGLLVAAGAGFVQFVLFRTNGAIWSLLAASWLTPLIDRVFPGPRYQWLAAPRRRDHAKGDAHAHPVTPVPAAAAAARGACGRA